MTKFFWYERNMFGDYSPVSSSDNPNNDSYKAKKQRYCLVELKPDELELSLSVLSKIYPPPDDTPQAVEPTPAPKPSEGGTTAEKEQVLST